jgi:hypothetical protein
MTNFLEKCSKNLEIQSGGRGVVTCGQMDGHDEFCEINLKIIFR